MSKHHSSSYPLLTALLLMLMLPSIAFQSITTVPKIRISEFMNDYKDRPLIIETGLPVESLCERLMDEIKTDIITLQNKSPKETKLYECNFEQAIDHIMLRSNHNNSFFAFCEGLLNDLKDFRQLNGKDLLLTTNDEDWFDHFPKQMQPTDCVIMAGEGATSTLHRDPFEWTGTSLCLEGSKLWRFLAPNNDEMTLEKVDTLLHSYRLPSIAWDTNGVDNGISLSAGWQSDFSLFTNRCQSVPSARSLSEMNDKQRFETLESIAMNGSSLKPNLNMDECSCWTVIQKPGDLIMIPAHWWHQTYALEPSLAVASQRCDSRKDAARVIRHILRTTGTLKTAPDLLLREDYTDYKNSKDVARVVTTLFDHLNESLMQNTSL